jgi:hypothetical protein
VNTDFNLSQIVGAEHLQPSGDAELLRCPRARPAERSSLVLPVSSPSSMRAVYGKCSLRYSLHSPGPRDGGGAAWCC